MNHFEFRHKRGTEDSVSGNMLPVGLALSGGTAKAVTHIGVIKALTEENVPISQIAGTSGGAMVGAFYASGMPLASLIELSNNLSWGKLISIRLSRLGFISSKRIEDFVKGIIGDVTFEDLKMPLHVVATDLETGRKHVFNSGPVARAVRASCSIPQIFLPVEIDGCYYVDGGFAEYLPVGTLHEIDEMMVIGSHLAHTKGIYRRPRNYLQLAMHIMGLVAKTNYVISREHADVLIHPHMDDFSPFNFDTAQSMNDLGYRMTKEAMPEIRRVWKQKSSRWHKFVQRLSFRAS
jgi:NTE family protein